jgi:hypothetical protein
VVGAAAETVVAGAAAGEMVVVGAAPEMDVAGAAAATRKDKNLWGNEGKDQTQGERAEGESPGTSDRRRRTART